MFGIPFRSTPFLIFCLFAVALSGCSRTSNEREAPPPKKSGKPRAPKLKQPVPPPPAASKKASSAPVAATKKGTPHRESIKLKMPGEGKEYEFSAKPVRLFIPAKDTPRPPGLGPKGSKEAFIKWVRERRREYHGPAGPPTMLLEDIVISEMRDLERRQDETPGFDGQLAKLIYPLEGKNVVDLAAGTGRLMPAWTTAAKARKVLLVDVDPVVVDIMAYRAAHEPSMKSNRERYIMLQDHPDDACLPGGWADAILCANMHTWVILSYEDDLDGLKRFWRGVIKGLKKGGVLVLVDQCVDGGKSCKEEPLEKKRTAVPHIAALDGVELQGFHLNTPRDGQWAAVFKRR